MVVAAIDRTLAFLLVCFPLALYVIVFAFAQRRQIAERFAYLDEQADAAEPDSWWRNAIMPYAPLPQNATSAYYADDVTPEGWAAMLRSLAGGETATRSWKRVPSSGTPRAALDGSLEALARRLRPEGWRPAKVAVDAAYESGSGSKGLHAWDVVACFHRSGKARGWCARMRVTADVSAGDPRRWAYGVDEGQTDPLGTISEDVILTRAAVALPPSSSPSSSSPSPATTST